jgi:hypothetical protein
VRIGFFRLSAYSPVIGEERLFDVPYATHRGTEDVAAGLQPRLPRAGLKARRDDTAAVAEATS